MQLQFWKVERSGSLVLNSPLRRGSPLRVGGMCTSGFMFICHSSITHLSPHLSPLISHISSALPGSGDRRADVSLKNLGARARAHNHLISLKTLKSLRALETLKPPSSPCLCSWAYFFKKSSKFAPLAPVFAYVCIPRPKKFEKTFRAHRACNWLFVKEKRPFLATTSAICQRFFLKNIWPYRKKLVLLHSQMRPRPYERQIRRSVLWNTYITFSREVQDHKIGRTAQRWVLRPGIKKDPRQV